MALLFMHCKLQPLLAPRLWTICCCPSSGLPSKQHSGLNFRALGSVSWRKHCFPPSPFMQDSIWRSVLAIPFSKCPLVLPSKPFSFHSGKHTDCFYLDSPIELAAFARAFKQGLTDFASGRILQNQTWPEPVFWSLICWNLTWEGYLRVHSQRVTWVEDSYERFRMPCNYSNVATLGLVPWPDSQRLMLFLKVRIAHEPHVF